MSPDHSAIDHLNLIWHGVTFIKRFKHQLPKSRQRPPSELTINTGPFAEFFGQIPPQRTSPRNPEDRAKETSVKVTLNHITDI